MNALITFVSKEKVSKKPDILNVGGYSVEIDGEVIGFDWLSYCASVKWTENGHLLVEVDLEDFDESHYGDVLDIVGHVGELSKFPLREVCYECYIEGEEAVGLELVSFVITDEINQVDYSFSDEIIAEWNEYVF